MSQFVTTRTVTARKAHRCLECVTNIQPGSRYAVISGRWDGRMYRVRLCLHCEGIWNMADTLLDVEGDQIAYGELFGYLCDLVCTTDDEGDATGVLPEYAHLFTFDAHRPGLPLIPVGGPQ